MKFDFIIGNPPYQEEMQDTSDKPIYNSFMDETYTVADKVMLITPARFLFNAGKTPKVWNEKMLTDPHFKIINYEQNSSLAFINTNIMGGVAISYHDVGKNYGGIGVFSPIKEMNSILSKVRNTMSASISDSIYAPESYKFSEVLHQEHSNVKSLLSQGHDFDLTTNIFDKLIGIVFFEQKPKDNSEYIQIVGRYGNERSSMWVKKKYIRDHENLNSYKVIVPKSNGSPAISNNTVTPLIGEPILGLPGFGHNQSFISIGAFKTKNEAEAALSYVKTKFARCMVAVLKVTQDNKKSVWKYVPLQDFTSASDIDWTKPIPDIDRQLYQKYGLDEKEIEFIETHVKEMN